VARAIHATSRRRDRPFVAVNCGALSETLLEAELFGSERGAYTGANASRPGLFVAAHGGTLLLDEVGDMPPAMQTALLRVLETSEVRAVGSTKPRSVDVRVIAATHRDLVDLVRKGAFRDDLRYRLEVIQLVVPPLRDRLETADSASICSRTLGTAGLPERRLSQAALDALLRRTWAGNVRELRHVLANAALSAESGLIAPEDLPPERTASASEAPAVASLDLAGPDGHATRVQAIRSALQATAGHRGRAAELLGISRSTLYRYLEIYEIDLAEFEPLGRAREES
jgi:transcriptional regulator with PAS, ATPase and Fis domain